VRAWFQLPVCVVDSVGVAGICAGQKVLCQHALLAIRIDGPTRKRHTGIKVADISTCVCVGRPAQLSSEAEAGRVVQVVWRAENLSHLDIYTSQ
jgi:hypothetical protein